MNERDSLAGRFEAYGDHLRSVAFRMLGSVADADDAVQETWLRLSRADVSAVDNLGGWLTTAVGRVCLDMLRARRSRPEEPIGTRLPEGFVSRDDTVDPEREALLVDTVGPALLAVLDTLAPVERLVFVLHDMFSVSFADIATIVGRSTSATRQLASRARRRVQGTPVVPQTDLSRQRAVVEAFLAASRRGDFQALLGLLAPDVVLHADAVPTVSGVQEVQGGKDVALRARLFSERSENAQSALVDGAPGIVVAPRGRLLTALRFGIVEQRITTIDVIIKSARLHETELAVLA